jgi:hypothetical protein
MTTQPQRAGLAWTTSEDDMLRDQFNEHCELEAIVLNHQRSVAAVITRMMDLGLLLNRGERYYRVEQDPWSSYGEARALKKKIYGE